MERVKNYLLGSAVVIITALVLTLATDIRRAVADEFKDVRVINAESMPAKVRDVSVPVRLPVQIKVDAFIRWGEPTFEEVIYTVPAGKRLVIQQVALESNALDAGNAVTGVLETSFRGQTFLHPFDLRAQAPVDGPLFVASHPLLAFADPGTPVWVTTILDETQQSGPGEGFSSLSGTLSGYLEEVAP